MVASGPCEIEGVIFFLGYMFKSSYKLGSSKRRGDLMDVKRGWQQSWPMSLDIALYFTEKSKCAPYHLKKILKIENVLERLYKISKIFSKMTLILKDFAHFSQI